MAALKQGFKWVRKGGTQPKNKRVFDLHFLHVLFLTFLQSLFKDAAGQDIAERAL